MITDGKLIAANIRSSMVEELKELREKYNRTPKLSTIIVGNDVSSHLYVKKKGKAAEDLGILFEKHELDENTSTEDVMKLIEKLNDDESCTAILVQLPLPNQDTDRVLESVSPEKDVDYLHPLNFGKMLSGNEDKFIPPTVSAVMEFLKDVNLMEKNIVVVGSGRLVGIPLSIHLSNKGATVTVCNEHTQNLGEYTRNADVIISGVGVPNLIKDDMVAENALVIDVGVNKLDDRVVGDVDYENVSKKAVVTPVPGGVGPVTVEMLLKNVLYLSRRQMEKSYRSG